MTYKSIFLAILTISLPLQNSSAFDFSFGLKNKERNYLYSVGSSTVSPFMSAVSEEFARDQNLKKIATETPVVESSGTRIGFKTFCSGVGKKYPDFANASRAIEKDELEFCHKNGAKEIVEIRIGYDGIVVANFKGSKKISLTKEQIFLALAEKIYDNQTHQLVKNPYKTWDQIDAKFAKTPIIFYGPPLTSGTRDLFVDMVMEESCIAKAEFVKAIPDHDLRKAQCHEIRHDGAFIESGENDNLIVSALKNNPQAIGIFGFNFLIANEKIIQPVKINNIDPSFETIASKHYALSRPLFVYFKKEHLNLMPQMRDFIRELISEETIGRKGYLIHSGLVAMDKSELEQVRNNTLSQL